MQIASVLWGAHMLAPGAGRQAGGRVGGAFVVRTASTCQSHMICCPNCCVGVLQ